MSRIRVLSGKRPIYTNIDIKIYMNISYMFSNIFSYIIYIGLPRYHGTTVPRYHGTMVPRYHGTTDLI